MPTNFQDVINALRDKAEIDQATGCWVWRGTLSGGHPGQRYPQWNGLGWRHAYAHRLMWELHHGVIPVGKHVCHRCDNSLCVNPEHLFLGTNTENRTDSVSKGRNARGVTHHWAVLGEADVLAIRADRANGMTLKQISAKYNRPRKTVEKIVYRVSWRHLP